MARPGLDAKRQQEQDNARHYAYDKPYRPRLWVSDQKQAAELHGGRSGEENTVYFHLWTISCGRALQLLRRGSRYWEIRQSFGLKALKPAARYCMH